MQTLEQYRRRLKTVSDIKSVVVTMKNLAAARIRQFESVANATRSYADNVEIALQALLNHDDRPATFARASGSDESGGWILLGTDQGFCGRFNANIATRACELLQNGRSRPNRCLCMGRKLGTQLENRNLKPDLVFPVPASVDRVNSIVHEILRAINEWRDRIGIESIQLVFHQRRRIADPEVVVHQLLPLDPDYLDTIRARRWESQALPIISINWREAFSSVIQQWLFIHVYRSVAESLASENSSRIAAMQKAEANIDQRFDELNATFNAFRQQLITDEIRDIIASFEAC